ncbi:hypothetical protein QBC46DRAFT_264508 [Diplogelasinospora grovesii]|uniref:Indole-diterpene biosynthesis protein PaxU n=1 Tax=Diplogelasinospora grovesii TaxID=303347 RepID=A0AAN6N4D7_9PEZI|nr:hypothetical protein QBC46DRAFT_264508 [Diplogelasinospora grovesii]
MASNAPTPPSAGAGAGADAGGGPLSFMSKISPNVYIYRPATPSSSSSSSSPPTTTTTPTPGGAPAAGGPKVILLATWMGAQDVHISKYLVRYQSLYPTSEIVLVRCELRHFLRGRAHVRAEVAPAVPFIQSALTTSSSSSSASLSPSSGSGSGFASASAPELLVHVWSNGGSNMLYTLYTLFTSQHLPFPRYAVIFDSTPGQWAYTRNLTAISMGLSPLMKFLFAPLLHAVVMWSWVMGRILVGKGGFFALLARSHNLPDREKVEVRRTYIYSKEDKLVDYRDVEEHAADAKQKGFSVRKEEFIGSAHVAHVRKDEGRYWRVVRETWEGTAQS